MASSETNGMENQDANRGPLKGLKVLDMTRILAGPTCTQLLGDLGADVIKIERPGSGDDTRKWGPPFVTGAGGEATSESAYYLCANRNKRSVAVDIASPDGAETVRRLAEKADVLIENFKPGGLAKYGLDYATLAAVSPGLVYCSITGFGQTGPNREKPGYDIMAQGIGGIMSLTGEPDGEPMKVGVGVADIVCGLYAATSVLAALRHRDASGEGQHIDLALVDTQVAWLVNEGLNYLTSGVAPRRYGNQHPNIVPYQVFAASNGHVIVAVGNDGQYRRFCRAVDLAELAEDERYATNSNRLARRDELVARIAARLEQLPASEIIARLEAVGVPVGPVNDLPAVFASDQVKARGMKISMPHAAAGSGKVDLIGNPVKMSKTPVSYRLAPPMAGEHTEQVIAEWLGEEAVRK